MDKKTYVRRFAIWTAVVIAAVFAICGLLWGRILEANLFEEVSKWVVIAIFIAVCVEALVGFVIAPFCYHWLHDGKE